MKLTITRNPGETKGDFVCTLHSQKEDKNNIQNFPKVSEIYVTSRTVNVLECSNYINVI